MIDVGGLLAEAIATTLRTDAGVAAAFSPAPVQIFEIVPENSVEPYLELPPGDELPILAEGFDLSEIEVAVHVWSRTDPPGFAEARAIATAIETALPGVQLAAGGRLYAVTPAGRTPLRDINDPRVVHLIVKARFTTAPA